MPVQLTKFSDYAKLPGLETGLSWICCDCLTVNRPSVLVCVACDKQRWGQLGLAYGDAADLAERIRDGSFALFTVPRRTT